MFARAGTIGDVTPGQLRGYMAEHDEREYQLVDVRQPEEYQQGHIPGALLIPVGELEARRPDVERLADRKAIFYCRSGVRSSRAAAWASQVCELPEVFNLLDDGTYQIYNPFVERGIQVNGRNEAQRRFGRRFQAGLLIRY